MGPANQQLQMELGLVVQMYNHRYLRTEAEGLQVQSLIGLQSKIKGSLCYLVNPATKLENIKRAGYIG